MLMRPAKCEAKAAARYHKAEVEARTKKIAKPNSVRLRPEMPY